MTLEEMSSFEFPLGISDEFIIDDLVRKTESMLLVNAINQQESSSSSTPSPPAILTPAIVNQQDSSTLPANLPPSSNAKIGQESSPAVVNQQQELGAVNQDSPPSNTPTLSPSSTSAVKSSASAPNITPQQSPSTTTIVNQDQQDFSSASAPGPAPKRLLPLLPFFDSPSTLLMMQAPDWPPPHQQEEKTPKKDSPPEYPDAWQQALHFPQFLKFIPGHTVGRMSTPSSIKPKKRLDSEAFVSSMASFVFRIQARRNRLPPPPPPLTNASSVLGEKNGSTNGR
mmetsp:Transcript_20589/g.33936  ORF Transcript_20589/g.33936 Transcript_20589/m.33936 type:complete len:283 (+) Transcript_20589:187-1035(+)